MVNLAALCYLHTWFTLLVQITSGYLGVLNFSMQ